MSKDAIYRQDAIDAIEKTYGSIAYQEDGFTRSDAIDILKSLPSAQPEIIRCKDCKQFRRWIDTDICFCDITESERSDDDFCSRAERRTDG